jgi:hypothetical protein
MSLREPAYEGLYTNDGFITFKSALVRGTDEDKPVKISANKTVALAGDGENFVGQVKTIANSDKAVGVQMAGFVKMLYTGGAPTFGENFLVGDGAGGVKVDTDPIVTVTAEITVLANGTVGASAAAPELIGGKVLGVVSTSNEDQLIDSVVLGADGAVTITLAAAATADNKFKVSVLKAPAFRSNKYKVVDVDTTNTLVTFLLA